MTPAARERHIAIMKARGYVPIAEAADRLGCHVATVKRHVGGGRLGGEKFHGAWYVVAAQIDGMMPEVAG